MFGLTRREQRWKAEQKAAEALIPLIAATVKAAAEIRVAEANTDSEELERLRAMAQAYENGYKAGAAAEREAIMDEWSACVQSDLENGVRWLNEQAAKKWQESYPAMAGFADKIYARGETK